jgi:guanine nucleotide-binding protein subunit alpha, other
MAKRKRSSLTREVSFIFRYADCGSGNLRWYLFSSLPYFFSELDRLFERKYQPTEQDIVRCRARTIGITETTFHLRDHEMLMVDVGGQKSERRKWIHCFQDVTSILFLVSLSGYDQCLVEDKDAVRHFICSVGLCGVNYVVEPNARRHDNMGFNMSFPVVQVDFDCEFFFHFLEDRPLTKVLQILFLNKNDLFEKKIEHSDIKNFFPVSRHTGRSLCNRG